MALLCSQSAFHRSPSALMNVNSQDPNLGAHAQVVLMFLVEPFRVLSHKVQEGENCSEIMRSKQSY